MTTLDRYVTRSYVFNTLMLFVIVCALVVVADYSMNFDEYTRLAGRVGGGGEASWVRRAVLSVFLVVDLWWPRFFQLYNFLIGLVMVGGMGFTLSQMVRHRELVAALASGMSLWRVARPMLIASVGLVVLQAVNREVIVPRLAELLTREKWDAGDRGIRAEALRLTGDARGRVLYAREFEPGEGVLEGLYVFERGEGGGLESWVYAERARWDEGARAWRLTNAQRRTVEGPQAGRGVEIEWLETDLDPTALTTRRFENFSQNLSTAQLGRLIDRTREEARASPDGVVGHAGERVSRLERLRASRVSTMASNLLALVVCLPFFLRREPTNMLVQALYCAPVALVAVMGSALGSTAAIPGLPASLGAFMPVIVLLPVAVASASLVKT